MAFPTRRSNYPNNTDIRGALYSPRTILLYTSEEVNRLAVLRFFLFARARSPRFVTGALGLLGSLNSAIRAKGVMEGRVDDGSAP